MDSMNRFHTDSSWRLVRVELLIPFISLLYLLLDFRNEVRWGLFLTIFVLIDLIGYLPGTIAYRIAAKRGPGQPIQISPVFHYLYNISHSFLTATVVIGLWFLWQGDFELEMFALPLHLLGDRALFGNVYKPVSLPFEPTVAVMLPTVPGQRKDRHP